MKMSEAPSITLEHVRQALVARRMVALTITSCASGWQASARSEGGSGWLVGIGPSIEEAVHELMANASRQPAWEGKTRYFEGPGGTMHITYNGTVPLRSEGGPFVEITAHEWAARRRTADTRAARDEFDELLGL